MQPHSLVTMLKSVLINRKTEMTVLWIFFIQVDTIFWIFIIHSDAGKRCGEMCFNENMILY